jgi:hypothetical protein
MASIISLQDWLEQKPENQINDQKLFLTEEEVRSFPQFKDASNEEVQNIIDTLHELALVAYELFCKETRQNQAVNEAA